MSDDNEWEEEDKGMLPDEHVRLSISVVIPASYFQAMTYDSFIAYTDTVSKEVSSRLKDAAVDEWFKKQPLYNGETAGEDNAN